jgi:formylglycine-generating enzyme required for sulfatase activity
MPSRTIAALAVAVIAGLSAAAQGDEASRPRPGQTFRDCADCPEMVVVPAGSFLMGSLEGDPQSFPDERPRHFVTLPRAFAVGVFEVTFAEWDACTRDGGCRHRPADNGWGRDRRPVINVSWVDAQDYVRWLRQKTGRDYRLPSEAEWEYAARAGSPTTRHWGEGIGDGYANCRGCGSAWDNRQTAPVGSFPPNDFGLRDVLGNVWEWVEDCWSPNYQGAPSDGSAWTTGKCRRRVLRGGSWVDLPAFVRLPDRIRADAGARVGNFGFRVAVSLP